MSRNIKRLEWHLGLYLAKNQDIFLNGIKGFGEHLGLYLTGVHRHVLFFSPLPPGPLIVRMIFSPRLDHLVPAEPVTRVLPAKALVALALSDFPAHRRTRLLAHSDPSVRHEHPVATLTLLLSSHHHSLSLSSVMASL